MENVPGKTVEVVSNTERSVSRDHFTTNLGVIAATLGSAVGLGNIWKFPSMTGANGGAAFLVVYLISTLLIGLPVMISEIMLGRHVRADAFTTYEKLSPRRQPWWLIGASGGLAAFLILAFYTEVAGWVFAYIFKAVSGAILSTDPATNSQAFASLISSPWQSLLWQWIVLVVIGLIILMGVSKGIENTTKRLMPVLFVLLVVLVMRSLTLPGAMQGLDFLFRPDFSALGPAAILAAMGLSFFKLSVGMGTMTTYGSYFRSDQNIPATTLRVMLADLLVSLLAGMAIFPAVFAFGFQPDAGPSLLFITIPAVFASLPLGGVFMAIFFLLAAIAATGAMLSLLEVPVAFLVDRLNWSRRTATLVTVVLLAAFGSTAALSSSLLADVHLFGMTFFDLFDYVTSNLLLPVGGLFILIFTGWVWGPSRFQEALSNQGQIHNYWVIRPLFFIVRYIAPLLVVLVLLKG
ncbi:MAG: sodium-dependent transporter, partial [Chloroflexi bacterium]|nr:sodium-dependent transporter [Chloroflexota bacterium]